MKKIGRGWQYSVYDLDNGSVRKKKYSKIFQFFYIVQDLWAEGRFWVFTEAWRERRRMEVEDRKAINYLKSIDDVIDWNLLGNPVFLDGAYDQDKVVPLEDVFEKVSIEEGKEVFNKFLALNYKLWEYGFSDKVFNFSINNGINKEGRIIQLDFGELSFDKEEMRKRIKEKCWLKRYSYYELLEGELKEYYRNMMNPEQMLLKLDEVWGIRLKNVSKPN